jgi:PiT family inorganic phosphate transporter
VTSIAAAWIITVPASAVVAAALFWILDLVIGA